MKFALPANAPKAIAIFGAVVLGFIVMAIFLTFLFPFPVENFQSGQFSPAPTTVFTATEKRVQSAPPAPAKEAEEVVVEPVEAEVSQSAEELNSREKELFEQITTNKLSGTDLEKLIKAGAVTEKMIEKFLSHLDTSSSKSGGSHIEAFCSGMDTGCALD